MLGKLTIVSNVQTMSRLSILESLGVKIGFFQLSKKSRSGGGPFSPSAFSASDIPSTYIRKCNRRF